MTTLLLIYFGSMLFNAPIALLHHIRIGNDIALSLAMVFIPVMNTLVSLGLIGFLAVSISKSIHKNMKS